MTTVENEGFLLYNKKIVIYRGDSPLVEAMKIWQGVYYQMVGGRWSNFWNIFFRNILKWKYKIYLMTDKRQQVS